MKFIKDLATITVLIIWFALVIIFYSCVEGAIVFILTAVVTGFLAWLFGSADPRDTALTISAIVAGLYAVSVFLYKVTSAWETFTKELQQQRIKEILESDD